MRIRVRHSNGKIELVTPRKLQKLINNHKIVQFMRSTGWVTVGFDPVRNGPDEVYAGPERRA